MNDIKFVSSLTGKLQEIKNGDRLTVKIIERISNETYRISLRGKLFTVNSKLLLTSGTLLRVNAYWKGTQLFLQLSHNNEGFQAVTRESGIPASPLSEAIIEAVQKSGMPLQPELLQALYNKCKKIGLKRKDTALIRLLVILRDKGIELSYEQITPLLQYTSAKRDHRQRKEKRQRQNQTTLEIPEASSLSNGNLSENIRYLLKQHLLRGTDVVEPSLLLFNHMISVHDNWIIIPFAVTVDEKTYTGSLKVKTGINHKDIVDYVISIHSTKAAWSFSVDKKQEKRETQSKNMHVFCDNDKLLDKVRQNKSAFSEKLRKLDAKIVDTIIEKRDFDGFSFGMRGEYKKINTIL